MSGTDIRYVLAVLRSEIAEVVGEPIDASDNDLQEMHMIEDLGLDSLDMMTVLFQVEEKFNLKILESDIDEKNLALIGNMAKYVTQTKVA